MNNRIVKINDYMSYLPATEDPLSADVGIVYTKAGTFFFDVGFSQEAFDLIKNTEGARHIVISHFHTDHAVNIQRLVEGKNLRLTSVSLEDMKNLTPETDTLTLGSFTYKKYGYCTNLRSLVNIETETLYGEPLSIQIGPFPNSHAKGSLYMMVNREYAFLGDGTYWNIHPDKRFYNVQVLKEEIDLLNKLPADKAVLSHAEPYIQKMEENAFL